MRDAGMSGAVYTAQIFTRPVARSAPPSTAGRLPFTAELSTRSHITIVRSPGSDVGPAPVHTPVTGHNLFLDLAADGADEVVLQGLWAQVVDRGPLEVNGVSMAMRRAPDIVYGADLEESARRGVANFEPLEIPQYEVILDATPALLRPARDPYGRRVRRTPDFPLRLAAGERTRLVLAAVTDDLAHVRWRLLADVSHAGRLWTVTWELALTGRSGLATFTPGADGPVTTPVQDLFPQHWVLRCRSGLCPLEPGPVPFDADGPVRLPAVAQAARVELADGAVVVTVDECEVPADPVAHPGLPVGSRLWVCTTAGLTRAGLHDVTVAVLRPTGGHDDELPRELLGLLDRMYRDARETGWSFGLGSTIGLPSPLRIGPAAIAGMLVTYPAADRAWFPANSPPLLLVPLLAGEAQVAGRFGHGRVLAQLAAEYDCFPYPWWFDPTRGPVLDLDEYSAATVLGDVPIVHAPYLQIVQTRQRLELVIDAEGCADLWETWQRAPERFALVPRYTTLTGRARVWSPGQHTTREIVAADRASPHIAGTQFLLITRGAKDPAAGPVEDGFSVSIPDRDWNFLGLNVLAGTSVTWDATATYEIGINVRRR